MTLFINSFAQYITLELGKVHISCLVSENIRCSIVRKMCILFMYNGSEDDQSDYSLILASNRDEYYHRASQNMCQWAEDPHIIGGRDLEVGDGGTWLALSPLRKKIGVLLNLPNVKKTNVKSRGKIVADFVRDDKPIMEYIEYIKDYSQDCNEFVFVATEINDLKPSIYTYSNANHKLSTHEEPYLAFGNCLPDAPLKKVQEGRNYIQEICQKYNKVTLENELIENLLEMLKSNERHLPDQQLEERRPEIYKELSSIFVCIPHHRYGTRTHTLVLLTKSGCLSIIEFTQEAPIDPLKPNWKKTMFVYNISSNL